MFRKFSSSLLHNSGVFRIYRCKKGFLLITELFQQNSEGNFSVSLRLLLLLSVKLHGRISLTDKKWVQNLFS